MRNLTDIKHRIKSVSDTRQITNAMETISVAKMRKAMVRYENSRHFFEATKNTINDIVCLTGDIPSEYFSEPKENARILHIVVASDKGLAGGFNHNVLKHAWAQIEGVENRRVFTVGQTAREFFEKKGVKAEEEFSDAAYDPDMKDAQMIADAVLGIYLSKQVDEIRISYTKMSAGMSMKPDTLKLLPCSHNEAQALKASMTLEKEYKLSEIEYDPSPDEVLRRLVPLYLKWIIYGALIQSSASEHCSRRYAMSNATKNASELLEDLRIQYNRARQEAITSELNEIITSSMGVVDENRQ